MVLFVTHISRGVGVGVVVVVVAAGVVVVVFLKKCTFVFVSKVRQADILYDEAQREVEKCGNSRISGTWDVETCSKQSYNQVTTTYSTQSFSKVAEE